MLLTNVVESTLTRGSGAPPRSQDASDVALNPDPNTRTCTRCPRSPNAGLVDETDTDGDDEPFAICASGSSMTRVGSGEQATTIRTVAIANNFRDGIVVVDLSMGVSGRNTDAVAINKRLGLVLFISGFLAVPS